MQCKECERYEKHQIHVGRIERTFLINENVTDADRAGLLVDLIVGRLKDHQALEHIPGVIYEGQLAA